MAKFHFTLNQYICIYPDYQNRGYGYDTLKLKEREHPEVRNWSLGSMKGSRRIWHLYEEFGFVRVGENEHEYEYGKNVD